MSKNVQVLVHPFAVHLLGSLSYISQSQLQLIATLLLFFIVHVMQHNPVDTNGAMPTGTHHTHTHTHTHMIQPFTYIIGAPEMSRPAVFVAKILHIVWSNYPGLIVSTIYIIGAPKMSRPAVFVAKILHIVWSNYPGLIVSTITSFAVVLATENIFRVKHLYII